MTVEISMLIAIVSCFIGLAGWLLGRDKKISSDAEWRGTVNTKLDAIHNDVNGICVDFKKMQDIQNEHGERLTAVEESTKQAHKRIDHIEKNSVL